MANDETDEIPTEESKPEETPKEEPDKEDEEEDVEAPMKLTSVRKKCKVDVEMEDGSTEQYILREMTGVMRDNWLNAMAKKSKTNAEGKTVGVRDFSGLQASLIAYCLYSLPDLKPVKIDKIQSFPSSAQSALFTRCERMNALTPISDKAEKKD